ncbi:lytic transglycosylase domain-containing protein [Actinacidiphila alni]|uniref:lytic transglycosylase domain-containing protein n=1 Tax=Actinacidiphila alni TaxID=380248 RepID=UPI003F4F4B30
MSARRYGRRLRRGAAGTAVAAAAMAALGASQAPGLLPVAHAAPQHAANSATPPPGPQIDGGSPYITDMPPLNTPTGPVASPTPGAPVGVTPIGPGGPSLPATVLDAYKRAEASVAASNPGCHLPWQLLAAIGQVESGQARGGAVDANGTTYTPILGPVLDGNGFANISDTDGGAYDGDATHDRAVGPMQFIPSTWQNWGADGNGDGVRNPNNVYDAALAAAHYLCADGRDLAVPADMDRAILGYNHSQAYLDLVRAWYEHFRSGDAVTVPDRSGTPAGGTPPYANTPKPSTSPSAPTTPGGQPSPSPSGSPSPTHVGGSVVPPTAGEPSTSPSKNPPTTGTPTTPPTTGTPTDPTDPPTTPGCPTDSPTPTPSDSASPSPTATDTPTPTDSPTGTPDPCATDTPTPSDSPSASGDGSTPSAEPTGSAATGEAVTAAP